MRVSSVDFSYGPGPLVLHNFSVEFRQRKTVLLGPNGAGKSTLCSILAGVRSPKAGGVVIGEEESRASRRDLSAHVGLMMQSVAPVPGLSVGEQVAYSGWLAGQSVAESAKSAEAALELVDLVDKRMDRSSKLSGGQLRRLGLAEVLVTRPKFLILDEPTAGLDPAQRHRFRQVLGELELQGGVLVVTHQVDDITSNYDEVVVVAEGQVKFQGTPKEFLALGGADCTADEAYLALLGGVDA